MRIVEIGIKMADKKGKTSGNRDKKGKSKALKKSMATVSKGKKTQGNHASREKVHTAKKEAASDRRDQNYSGNELDVLVKMCKGKIDLLESNLSAEVTREMKDDAWKSIADGVNG